MPPCAASEARSARRAATHGPPWRALSVVGGERRHIFLRGLLRPKVLWLRYGRLMMGAVGGGEAEGQGTGDEDEDGSGDQGGDEVGVWGGDEDGD